MNEEKELDIYDVDWDAEREKWNYVTYEEEEEWYRYAIHNIVDLSEPFYLNEWDAYWWLFEHLTSCEYPIAYLPPKKWKWE